MTAERSFWAISVASNSSRSLRQTSQPPQAGLVVGLAEVVEQERTAAGLQLAVPDHLLQLVARACALGLVLDLFDEAGQRVRSEAP